MSEYASSFTLLAAASALNSLNVSNFGNFSLTHSGESILVAPSIDSGFALASSIICFNLGPIVASALIGNSFSAATKSSPCCFNVASTSAGVSSGETATSLGAFASYFVIASSACFSTSGVIGATSCGAFGSSAGGSPTSCGAFGSSAGGSPTSLAPPPVSVLVGVSLLVPKILPSGSLISCV